MSLKDDICHALCDGFTVTSVPVGFAVKSPFQWHSGDDLVFYVRKEGGGRYRLEDDGASYAELQTMGVDFSSDTRMNVLSSLLEEHNVRFDQADFLFHSDWVSEKEIGKSVGNFLSFMNRLQDLLFLTQSRVANTFSDDLFQAQKFADKAKELGCAENEKGFEKALKSLADTKAEGANRKPKKTR